MLAGIASFRASYLISEWFVGRGLNGGTHSGSYNPPRRQGSTLGTLPKHSLSFGILLATCLVTMVALSYLPSLVLGALLERFLLSKWRVELQRCQPSSAHSNGLNN